ncbi:TM2 domain-containing membrane protein YozV [Oxalobacteraceae bacterium GrIS 1.11]
MKRSIKAALLSALVFPGIGHFTLGRAARGCLFLLPSALGAFYLVRQVSENANRIVDQIMNGSLPADPQVIAANLSAVEGTLPTLALTVCALCWIGAIIDSFLIGAPPRHE